MIFKGQIYYCKKKGFYKRVLYVDPSKAFCCTITISKTGKFIESSIFSDYQDFQDEVVSLELMPKDPFNKLVDLYDTKKNHDLRDKRYEWIKPIIENKPNCYDENWRKDEVKKRFIELNPDLPTKGKIYVSKYKLETSLNNFFASGEKKYSLDDNYDKCGGPGKQRDPKEKKLGRPHLEPKDWEMNLAPIDKENIKNGYFKFKSKKYKSKEENAYLDFKNKYYDGASHYPSENQFLKWGKRLNKKEKIIKAEIGINNFQKDVQVKTGDSREFAFGIGYEAQMDTTVDDTHTRSLVFPNTFMGRLTFSMMIDSATGMPLGLTLVPDAASHQTSIYTVINAASNKREFATDLGIPDVKDEDWPAKGLAAKIIGDCGLLFGPHSDAVPEILGVEINTVSASRGDLKGIIERHIGKALRKIEDVVADCGLVTKFNTYREKTDPKKNAILNYRELLKIIVTELLHWIKYEPIEGYATPPELEKMDLLPTTLNLWNYHKDQGNDAMVDVDPTTLLISLLPKTLKSFNSNGILFYKKRWKCITEEGINAFKELVYADNKPEKVKVAFSKVDTTKVFWYYNGKHYPLARIRSKIEQQTFYEVEIQNERTLMLQRINNEEKREPALKKRKQQHETVAVAKQRARKAGKLRLNNSPEAKHADSAYHYNTIVNSSTVETESSDDADSNVEDLSMPDL